MVIARRIGLALALVVGAALVTAFLFAPARAAEVVKGSNILSFQLVHGDADFGTPEGLSPGEVTAYSHSEWGGQVQFQRLLSDDWALALSGGIGTFKETDEPGDNASPLEEDFEYSQSSVQFRVGADRFVHISPTFHLFVGPGIQYWSGSAKFESGGISVESENTTRISLNGRMGAHISLGSSFGLTGHIGHYLGTASAEDAGAKVSWMPSGFESAAGISFKL